MMKESTKYRFNCKKKNRKVFSLMMQAILFSDEFQLCLSLIHYLMISGTFGTQPQAEISGALLRHRCESSVAVMAHIILFYSLDLLE